MSKYFKNEKLKLMPIININKSAQSLNLNLDESMGINPLHKDSLNNPISISNNKNNITIDYLNHYSPTNRSPISLPPLVKKTKNSSNSQNKNNINNNNIILRKFSPKKLFGKNLNKNAQNIKINNFNRLNIFIHSEGKNEEQKNNNLMTVENNNIKNNNNIYFIFFNNKEKKNNNNNNNQRINLFINSSKNKSQKKIYPLYSPVILKENIINKNSENNNNSMSISASLNFNNRYNSINNTKENNINETLEKKIKNDIDKNKNLNNFSLPNIKNKRLPSIINNNITNNNNSNFKSFDNNISSFINENKDKINKQKNDIIQNNISKEIDYTKIDNIDTSLNFLKDLTTDKSNNFINFLILIQTHLEIELFFDSLYIINNMNTFRKKKQGNNNSISINKQFQLKELINNYFNIFSDIYKKNIDLNDIKYPIDSFFLFPMLNNIFHKCFKIQICLYSIILTTLNQLTEIEINILIKNHLTQLLKKISFPLLIIYENFIKDEINLKYQEIFGEHLKKDFNSNFNKLFQEKKIPSKNNNNISNSQLVDQISKDLDKCIYSLQYYSTVNIKNSEIRIFGDIINQMIASIDLKTLNQFVIIFLDCILFSELEENHNKLKKANNDIINSINDFAPFLPELNPKYKYTLVLDMDETLVHFFFTKNIGMFFIRPYCFEFLRQLKEFYEIITFTAGTKEYADYILNLLDPNYEFIKYRLYRQHVTILGCSVYKDLNKLGRDLSKVIIVDNMKDNFKLQPNNGLYVKTWINDINDYQFKDLLKILKDIVLLKVVDVRPIIEKINEEINKENNLINPYYNINIERIINKIGQKEI